MGGFGSLYVGTSGLQMSQNALNTTGHNLANIDTAGYTRQQIVQSDSIYNNIKESYLSKSQIGLGTNIAAVRQVRDIFRDQEYRVSKGRQGFYEESFNAIDEMQKYFGELETKKFSTALDDLWYAVSEVAKKPDDSVNLATLKEMSVTFVKRANAVYQGLAKYQSEMNQQISDAVDRINELTRDIHELNLQIRDIELGSTEHANDLRDLRNSALDELSGYLFIDYSEDAEGLVHVRTEGVELVTGLTYHKMDVRSDSINDFLTPYWPHVREDVFDFSIEISTRLSTDIGSLKAIILARGDHKATFADMPVEPKESDYATTAEYDAAVADYAKKLKTYNAYTSNSAIMNVQAEFDQLFHGIVTTMNDILCPNKTITDSTGKTYQVLDEANAAYGKDGRQGVELFSRMDTPRYTKQTIDGTDYWVYNEEDLSNPLDRSTWYSIGKVEVNREVIADPTCLGFFKANMEDVDFERANALLQSWSDGFAVLNPNILDPSNFVDYYNAMIGEIATRGSVYSGTAEAMADSTNYLDMKRQESTGVSSEEELTNMIKFQSAFNAASRYMTTVSEMLEHLIVSLGA